MKRWLLIGGGLAGLVLAGGLIYFLTRNRGDEQRVADAQNSQTQSSNMQNEEQATKDCTSNPTPVFRAHITDLSLISEIIPPGNTAANLSRPGEMILKSHAWLTASKEVPVFAPTDAVLYAGSFYTEEGIDQYGLFLDVSCEVFLFFDHIQRPSDKLQSAFTESARSAERFERLETPVSFTAGEVIGYTTGTTGPHRWDFGAYDREKVAQIEGPEGVTLYPRDNLAICPFDLYPTDMKEEYYQRFASLKGEPIPTLYCSD